MLRWFVLIGVLVGAVACGSDAQSPTGGVDDLWVTVPQNGEQLQQVRQRTRALDVCALLPREELATVGEVVVRTTGPGACEATAGEETTVIWSVEVDAVTGATEMPYGRTSTVGDTSVWTVSDRDTRPDADPAELTERTCSATARYPSTASFYLQATTPPETDPCPIVEKLLPTALTQWAAEPAQGSSPDTEVTALTGQDPCAVPRTLDGAALDDAQTLWTCSFTYRGDEILMEYKYQPIIAGVEREVEFTVAGNPVDRYDAGDGHLTYNAVAGAPVAVEEATYSNGREPMVSVHGSDAAVLEEVVRLVVEQLPQP
ncbi:MULTISPECIES: hypothetical protein [Nocardia]|uniref:hypothetical protein n=1 Tax=Nocardia TaxID=1817 RepID=UPI0018946333|nr:MULTISPECIES: hypothetical protein [Nocardia]MBF6351274.1 hypothetical protein [Nocardia flavorosea]